MSKIQQYYDETAEYYQKLGLNDRNYKIHELLLRFGLQKTDNVLEIGCGVGVHRSKICRARNVAGAGAHARVILRDERYVISAMP